MARAWPFEGVEERELFREPKNFAQARGQGTEAVIVRIGLHDAQAILVGPDGRWQRWVYRSVEEAREALAELEIPVHEGEYPEDLRVRINSYVRPQEDFDRSAYPEQGAVGPVIPYPENRPRRKDVPRKEVSEQDPAGEGS